MMMSESSFMTLYITYTFFGFEPVGHLNAFFDIWTYDDVRSGFMT